MRVPEKFWKRLTIGLVVLAAIVAVPWVGLRLLAELFRDTQIILANNTGIPLQVTAIKQSHDNNEIYMKLPVVSEPDKKFIIDGSVDSVRCIFVTGVGGMHFDVAFADQPPLSSVVTVTDSKNLFGGDVKDYNANLSEILAALKTNGCPYMDYIGKVPPAKISQ